MASHRMYGDLARWWPLISPPEDYEEEAAFYAELLGRVEAREVLELGSGGGHNAVHMKRHFAMTLVDLSPDMLAESRTLNPDCEHIEGDMRTVRLGRTFDAVFTHDAIAYMLTLDDLRQAIRTAYEHCRPGGLALFTPDDTVESYEPGTDVGGTSGADGSGARYLGWWHPLESDGVARGDYVFLLRDASGSVETAHDVHHVGVFSKQVWLDTLSEAGFRPEVVPEVTTEDRRPRDLFLANKL